AVVELAHVAERELAVLPALLEADAQAIARAVDEREVRRHVADVVVHVAEGHQPGFSYRILRTKRRADAPLEALAAEHAVVVIRPRVDLPAAGLPQVRESEPERILVEVRRVRVADDVRACVEPDRVARTDAAAHEAEDLEQPALGREAGGQARLLEECDVVVVAYGEVEQSDPFRGR